MASTDPVYIFHAQVRKAASGPTVLHFVSPTPPDQVVSVIPTVLKEFGVKESSPLNVKPDPDAEPARPPLSQPLHARQSRSAVPLPSHHAREATPARSLVSSPRASSVPLQPALVHAGSAVRAGSVGPRPPVGRVQIAGEIPSSASRAGAPRRAPPRPEDFNDPPVLPPPSGRITRSLSMRTVQSSKTQVASPAVDPSLTGITAPEPMDPNDYIRYKKSCQLTDEEKGRNRKGKSQELVTAWFEYEAQFPLRQPPNLSGHNKIQHGDIFWFRSPFGIQLWLWTEGEDNGEDFWRPIPLGVCRNVDGRYLGLNPSQKPSWVTETWLGKQKKNSVRVYIFKVT